MDDVYIGTGKLAGKGVYAARDFEPGEIVKHYNLQELSQIQFDALPTSEHMFVHSFRGKMYLFPEPSRYTNHSPQPNTQSDLEKMCDYAIRPIKKGEMITTNASKEIRNELITFVEALEQTTVKDFTWDRGGYRNAVISYSLAGKRRTLSLQRIRGNWRVKDSLQSP